jgi:porin
VRTAIALAILVVSSRAFADDPPDPCASSMTRPASVRQSTLTGDWNGWRTWLADHGVTPGLSYAPEVFASPETDRHAVVAGLAVLALELDLAKLVAEGLGTIHVVGLGIHGQGLSEQIMDIYGVSNNVAASDVRLFEAWIEQPITDRAAIRAGLVAADQEFVIARHSTVLINATFGVIGQVSADVIGPVYPVATPGVSARADLGEVSLRAAVYDGQQANAHGLPTSLGESALGVGEVELFRTVKLGGWVHTARANGVYAVVDRALPSLGHRVGVFARVGYAPHGLVQIYADAGVRGPPGTWRPHDFAGLGVAFSRTDDGTARTDQAVLEATYQVAATGWLTLQPDAQLVFGPDRPALIGAVRMTLVF